MSKYKLVMFDMDGTLLNGRGICTIAKKLGFYDELIRLFKYEGIKFYEKSIEIARLTKGFTKNQFLEIFRTIPYQDHVETVIKELEKHNVTTAITTDSYQLLADDIKKRLDIDYAFANNLITNDDVITGELELHNKELKKDFFSERVYSICKSCVLENLCNDLDIPVEDAIAVGDGRVDIGMIKKAGLGIAYRASEDVQRHADCVTDDLSIILRYI